MKMHLVVVIDSEDGSMSVTTPDHGPVYDFLDVFDPEADEWRSRTRAEDVKLTQAQAVLTDVLRSAGLTTGEAR